MPDGSLSFQFNINTVSLPVGTKLSNKSTLHKVVRVGSKNSVSGLLRVTEGLLLFSSFYSRSMDSDSGRKKAPFIGRWFAILTIVQGFIYLAASGLSYGTQALGHMVSVVMKRRLSCSVACGILIPQPGIEPMSPALPSGFSTTGPPGKSLLVTGLSHTLHPIGLCVSHKVISQLDP